MPIAPPKPCRRCRRPTRNKGGLCDACRARRKDQRRQLEPKKETKPFYGTARWKKVRAMYLRDHPLCELCQSKGRATVATLVDHVHEIEDGGAELAMNNLMALCTRCHASKTKRMAVARSHGEEVVSSLVGELMMGRGGQNH
ncbi:hypothetical protein DSCO28_17580 [Desulfosarcina ovata subsp. sediminis]|uniref:Putative HNH nuclease YajD n=1 Tax=Desulfosarcina ovata subsp. sediminis TaxID=885957 RepID=A0A5K7ZGH6_9BACT|nr:HNH endonuclease [Desulfosarcina ovata]BBO81192.1 hypothetical protein DSCO28_17580 [Desulfosarcina ovata subsp. sediminis]